MKAQWQQLNARFGALQKRERLSVCVLVAGGVLFLSYRFAVLPAENRQRLALKEQAELQASTAQIAAQLQQLLARNQRDPNQALRQELQHVQQQKQSQREKLLNSGSGLATPGQLASLLRALLAKQPGVSLLALRTEPATPFKAPAATAPQTPESAAAAPALPSLLFQHKLSVSVSGSYAELARYLAAVEQAAEGARIDQVSYTVEQWPQAKLTIELSTYSLEAVWLGV